MSASCPHDPFKEARAATGVLATTFQQEKIPMLLRHEDVRRAARDWQTYSSDAPFRVPIPSEEDARRMRQLPIETDPPQADPKFILTATEEFVRVATSLTHIGRQCPVETRVGPETVAAGDRISLCWASANLDETVFEAPEEMRLNRRPNPYFAFGSGIHLCPGAAHARLIVRSVIRELCARVKSVSLLDFTPQMERETTYQRRNAFESLTVKIRLR